MGMLLNRAKDCICIGLIVYYGPLVLKMCWWPVTDQQRIGLGIVGLAACAYILSNRTGEPQTTGDIIDTVFERSNVGIKVDSETTLRPVKIFETEVI